MDRRQFLTTSAVAAGIAAVGLPAASIPAAAAVDDRAPAGKNSIDRIIADMTSDNWRNYRTPDKPWSRLAHSVLVMGNIPRGTNAPDWWTKHLVDHRYLDGDAWPVIQPWFVVEGAPWNFNERYNTRVRISPMRVNILEGNTWKQLRSESLGGGRYNTDQTEWIDDGDVRYFGSALDIKPPADRAQGVYHGWGEMFDAAQYGIDMNKLRAVHVAVDAKLVVDDPNQPHYGNAALFGLTVGADYKPSTIAQAEHDPGMAGITWYPGVGQNSSRRIWADWQTFNFITIAEARAHEPGGGIPAAEIYKNPPPLN